MIDSIRKHFLQEAHEIIYFLIWRDCRHWSLLSLITVICRNRINYRPWADEMHTRHKIDGAIRGGILSCWQPLSDSQINSAKIYKKRPQQTSNWWSDNWLNFSHLVEEKGRRGARQRLRRWLPFCLLVKAGTAANKLPIAMLW